MNPVGKADMVAFLLRQLGTLRGLEDGEKAQHIAGNLLQVYEVRTRDMLPSTTAPSGRVYPAHRVRNSNLPSRREQLRGY